MGPRGLITIGLIVVQIFAARYTSAQAVTEEPELAFQDSFLPLEERIGACERGSLLFLDSTQNNQLGVCGCCLKTSQVWYTTCSEDSDDVSVSTFNLTQQLFNNLRFFSNFERIRPHFVDEYMQKLGEGAHFRSPRTNEISLG